MNTWHPLLLIAALAGAGAPVLPSTPAPSRTALRAPVADDGCVLRPTFRTGRRLVYTFTTTSEVFRDEPAPSPGGEPPKPTRRNTVEATLRFTVLGVDEKGAAKLVMLVDRVKLVAQADGPETTAQMTREEAEKAEPLGEGAPLIQRLALALAGVTGEVDVTADGAVTEISGLKDAHELAQSSPEGKQILGALMPENLKRTLATFFRIDTPGADGAYAKRQVGDTWEMKERRAGQSADLVYVSTLKLDACAPEEAKISATSKASFERAKDTPPDAGAPVPVIDAQSDALTVSWNPAAGVLKKRVRQTGMTMTTRLGTASGRSRVTGRVTIDLVELKDSSSP